MDVSKLAWWGNWKSEELKGAVHQTKLLGAVPVARFVRRHGRSGYSLRPVRIAGHSRACWRFDGLHCWVRWQGRGSALLQLQPAQRDAVPGAGKPGYGRGPAI